MNITYFPHNVNISVSSSFTILPTATLFQQIYPSQPTAVAACGSEAILIYCVPCGPALPCTFPHRGLQQQQQSGPKYLRVCVGNFSILHALLLREFLCDR
jgi:hypothetical protein